MTKDELLEKNVELNKDVRDYERTIHSMKNTITLLLEKADYSLDERIELALTIHKSLRFAKLGDDNYEFRYDILSGYCTFFTKTLSAGIDNLLKQ